MIYYIIIGILIFIIGIFTGTVMVRHHYNKRAFGTLKWAQSEDGPYLFLDMDRPPENMPKHSFVVFKTDLREGSHE